MAAAHAPAITTADIRDLLASPAEHPVLYVKLDEDDGTPEGLDVWASAYVSHHAVVLTREDAEDLLGADPAQADIAEHLPVWQDEAERVVQELGS